MAQREEVLKGYVVDVACIRKYSRDELLERARQHTRACAPMGHCLESGYALIGEEGELALLDAEATLMVVDALRSTYKEKGIRLQVTRELRDQVMRTARVDLL
jgi:hypothetical protein